MVASARSPFTPRSASGVAAFFGRVANEQILQLGAVTERLCPGRGTAERQHALAVHRDAPFVLFDDVNEIDSWRGRHIHACSDCKRCARKESRASTSVVNPT